jgi:hypothetical protein
MVNRFPRITELITNLSCQQASNLIQANQLCSVGYGSAAMMLSAIALLPTEHGCETQMLLLEAYVQQMIMLGMDWEKFSSIALISRVL